MNRVQAYVGAAALSEPGRFADQLLDEGIVVHAMGNGSVARAGQEIGLERSDQSVSRHKKSDNGQEDSCER